MQIKFCGATKEVTGSCYVFTVNGKQVAFEAGMFQGHRKEAAEKNEHPILDPSKLSAVVLSHAHVDHCGLLPLFYKKGFKGKVYATSATVDLAEAILKDAAFIQEHDAQVWNKRHKMRNWIKPLYTREDAMGVFGLFEGKKMYKKFEVVPGLCVTFYRAGHILGSAQELIEVEENGKKTKIYFTGDLGRKNLPIINDPDVIEEADVLITESTYGNRLHHPFQQDRLDFVNVIKETYERGGKVIIPSFAMERTQEIIYLLHEAFNEKLLPRIPVIVDSPLAINVTEIFKKHIELFDKETQEAFLDKNMDPFGFELLSYTQSKEESQALTASVEPGIIISASGMCEAGRVLHHLEHGVSDPRNTILIVGFMAEGTLGRALVEGKPTVKIFGEEHEVKAEIKIFNNFSAHADRDEIMDQLKDLKGVQKAFVVHGEPEAAENLANLLRTEKKIAEVFVPGRGEEFEL